MSNRKKYADGYLPKIAYHITKGNIKAINWFTEKHEEKYGPLTFDDISKVISMVTDEVKGLRTALKR
tara:strand:+ start:705 stop:905 length:201 start_codon:yes stop_codon:yes gene_type:complete